VGRPMPSARLWNAETSESLDPAFARLGLPRSARDYLLEKLPHRTLLLTGLSEPELRFLRSRADLSTAPGHEAYPSLVIGDPRSRPGTALLFGRNAQHDRLANDASIEPGLADLAQALRQALHRQAAPSSFRVGTRNYSTAAGPLLMGIVNVTPDSFSDGGRYLESQAAIEHGVSLAKAGAHFLDVGGESSRPGASPVSADEELSRVLPVIRALCDRTDLPISIDTMKSGVAREALRAGAVWVNDISGLSDPEMGQVVAQAGASCCLMHMQGSPRTMQTAPSYEDCIEDVVDYLRARVSRAEAAGIPREQMLVDPGIGFGKTLGHNLFLLRRLGELRVLGLPILVGTSRKAFLGKLTHQSQASERLSATLGSVAAVAALSGAEVFRVHDPAEARDALTVAHAIRTAADGGNSFSF
jgi:dihydropteroate synthase